MVSSVFIAAALSALPMAFANYYQYPNTTVAYAPAPTGTGSASPSVQTVTVGKGGLVFTPDTIHAKVGDLITFQFFPKNHSIVQADFNNPCNPSENGGIFSGFFPTPAPGPSNATFTITVENEKPMWLYCSALMPMPHCAAGMVAVINPPPSGPNTLAAFREAAKKTTTSTNPETPPNGGEVESAKPSESATATSAPTETATSTATSTGAPAEFTGAASSLVVSSGAIGAVAAIFALFI